METVDSNVDKVDNPIENNLDNIDNNVYNTVDNIVDSNNPLIGKKVKNFIDHVSC